MSVLDGVRGFLFDLDGTLVDNTAAHLAAWEIVMRRHGIPPQHPEDLARRIAGRVNVEFVRDVIAPGLDVESARRIGDEKEEEYRGLYQPAEIAGARAFIAAARAAGLRIGVASSACRPNVDHVLGGLGLLDQFDVLLCEGAVERGKPAPDIFLEAARRLALEPGECLVFEDAPSGIAAARGAGMPVVVLTTTVRRAELEREPGVVAILDDYQNAAACLGLPAPLELSS